MIFVCLGTQIFQFNRLLKELDRLVENGFIQDEIKAQIGSSDYIPVHFFSKRFMDKEEFECYQKEASIIITHGGTGAIISASKLGKNIIAVPRLNKYGEHVDDHQLQIVKVLSDEGYIRSVYEIGDLLDIINMAKKAPINKKYSIPSNVIEIITNYLENDI